MKYLISFLFLVLSFSMKSEAKVTLPSILGDNMVLQQQTEVVVGWKRKLVFEGIYPCCGRNLQDYFQ